ncbi:TRAP transporter small permease subunit [Geopsychrobacter electrodiphilus]|uniref:TRAP transporter small permease subunit n=1 Tax=Geopsychrobacter electrodiphilus TaxID=225196 RepID=UPI0003720B5D|nr:TRAP transporter small permease subunit [Geopsychrobacter electrodiphilus]
MLLKIEKWIDRFIDIIGGIATVAMLLMMLNVFYDAIMRYAFNVSSIGMQEMEWHLFSVVFLLGIAYALKSDGHVRVDILYDRWSPQTQAVINIAGTLLLMIPLSLLIIHGSIWFVHEAYISGEISGDPGGLTHRWLIKAVIPLSFIFLVISAIGFMIRNFNIYRGIEAPKAHSVEDDVF